MTHNWWRRLVRASGWLLYAGWTIFAWMCIAISDRCLHEGNCGWLIAGGILVAFWALATIVLAVIIICEAMTEFNIWVRDGVFKNKNVDKTRVKIISHNASIMESIADIADMTMRLVQIRRYDDDTISMSKATIIKSSRWILHFDGGEKWYVVRAVSRKRCLIFHVERDKEVLKLINCDINNIFALPGIAEELAVILDGYQVDKQVTKRERQDAESDFRAYVDAVSEML